MHNNEMVQDVIRSEQPCSHEPKKRGGGFKGVSGGTQGCEYKRSEEKANEREKIFIFKWRKITPLRWNVATCTFEYNFLKHFECHSQMLSFSAFEHGNFHFFFGLRFS